MRHRASLLAALVVVFTSSAAWSAMKPRLFGVRLRDGTYVVGEMDLGAAVVDTPYGKLVVPAGDILSITFDPDGPDDKVVALRMTMTGEVAKADIRLRTKPFGLLQIKKEDIASIELVGGGEAFVGKWKGLCVDKPGEGTSRDRLKLELKIGRDGKLTGSASGAFVGGRSKEEIQDAAVRAGRLTFTIQSRAGKMRLSLALKDGKLAGEGEPVGGGGDRCDVTLEREKP